MSFRKIWAQQQLLKYLKIWITVFDLPSAQQYALSRKLNNNIGKKTDFSSSVAPAERAAGMARLSLLGEATPCRPTPLCHSCSGAGGAPRGLPTRPLALGR